MRDGVESYGGNGDVDGVSIRDEMDDQFVAPYITDIDLPTESAVLIKRQNHHHCQALPASRRSKFLG